MREKCESKIFYVAFLNVIACIAVVFLHRNKVFCSRPFGRLWITSNVIETGFYWAVPIFFMNIGVTSLDFDKKYTIKNF